MRSELIRVYKSLHTWTGLIAGMALFICFYAGALTMFEEQLARWSASANTAQPWIEPAQRPLLIEQFRQQHPQATRFTLHLEPREDLAAPLAWREQRRGPQQWASLDAHGALWQSDWQPSQAAQLIDRLHQTAGIPGEGHHAFGVYVMGAVSVLYVLALVSGLMVLLPTLVSDLFALRPGKNRKRFWLDAHNVVGIASLPFHLVIGLSVIVFAFHDQLYGALGALVYDGPLFEGRGRGGDTVYGGALMAPGQLLHQLQQYAPDFTPRELLYELDGARPSVRIAGEAPFEMLRGATRGFATLDATTGALLDDTYLPGVGTGWGNVVTTFFALHFGNFGGALIRWSYFLLGLAGAFLFYSGNLLWIESRRRRQRRRSGPVMQTRSAYWMAAATVGVCWGSVAGISCALVAGRWLRGLVADPDRWFMPIYYIVFLGAIAWAMWRGAARSVVPLLRCCALAMLALPLTGTLARLLPASPAGLHAAPDLLAVESTALVAGVLLWLAAARTSRRIAGCGSDSVWHAGGAGSNGHAKGVAGACGDRPIPNENVGVRGQ